MAQRLKRWESPRREGRNHKGKGGSARQRQRRKQFQVLRQRLKDQSHNPNDASSNQKAESKSRKGRQHTSPNFLHKSSAQPFTPYPLFSPDC
ncbi:MAG: hypothetical protein K6T90_19825 [Leptolyngbyaceae cyanobacterium HOT.MB2.61]|jgi:hypothetical protein|nr:hypothetical protein [Leptolyngbyaceae cyanobacterium HOT.MB2.61]